MGAKNQTMNNVIDNFSQILEFAKNYNLPVTKKRAILREFLQSKILEMIYQEKTSLHLYFVGGTSLRLLRGLDRFSEDLDFDLGPISYSDINLLMKKISRRFKQENISCDLYQNFTKRRAYYELRFRDLLYELKISPNTDEKLAIKFDFETFWKGEKKEILLFNRYGFLVQIVTVPLNQLLVQKLHAYFARKETQPRDIYDLVWLVAQGIKPDAYFMKANKLPQDLVVKAIVKFQKEQKKLPNFQRKLRPFLIHEANATKLYLFATVFDKIRKS